MKKIGILIMCFMTLTLTACQEKKQLDTFIGTPHMYVSKDGEIEVSANPQESEDYFSSTEEFDKLLNEYNLVDKDKKSGEIIPITYAEFLKMLEKKESFIALVSQTSCSHCKQFKEDVLDKYIEENGAKIYEINVTLEDNPQETWDALKEFVENE